MFCVVLFGPETASCPCRSFLVIGEVVSCSHQAAHWQHISWALSTLCARASDGCGEGWDLYHARSWMIENLVFTFKLLVWTSSFSSRFWPWGQQVLTCCTYVFASVWQIALSTFALLVTCLGIWLVLDMWSHNGNKNKLWMYLTCSVAFY